MIRSHLLGILMCGVCSAAVTVSVSPSTTTVNTGSQASFDINITGLPNGTSVGTFDVNVAFDPALLAYSAASFGNQLDILGLGDIQVVTPGVGTVELFELSLDTAANLNSLQAKSFRLATVTFNTVAAGNSPITISINAIGDALGNSIGVAIQNGSVSIVTATASVPALSDPALAALGLLLAASASLLARRGMESLDSRR
jgi:hypothetical protein